jgi:hypothetical protein
MRIARILGVVLLVLVGLSGSAHAIGLYVERLDDLNVNFCPVCHQLIMPGGIHENAEDVIGTELGGALRSRGRRAASTCLFTAFRNDGEARFPWSDPRVSASTSISLTRAVS